MITCRLDDNLLLPRTIQDCFVGINIEDNQLMNDFIANEFNPLSITITSVENMPSTPISYSELRQRLIYLTKNYFSYMILIRCDPVYCSYQLFDQPIHQTSRRLQGAHIYWNDFNLCFTSEDEKNDFVFQNKFPCFFFRFNQ